MKETKNFVGVRLQPGLCEAIDKYRADRCGVPVANVVRAALQLFLEKAGSFPLIPAEAIAPIAEVAEVSEPKKPARKRGAK